MSKEGALHISRQTASTGRVQNRRLFPGLAASTAVAILAGSVSEVAAQVISVNVVGGQTDPGSGGPGAAAVGAGEVAGVIRVAGWNDLTGNIEGSTPVFNNLGAPAGAVSWSVNNTWAATATPATADARLMNGYLDNLHSQPPPNNAISVTGLGPAFTGPGYDVLVYQNSDSAGSFGFTVADNAANSGTLYGRQLAGGGGNYPLGGPDGYVEGTSTDPAGPGDASNYIRVRGLTGDSFTITGLLGATGDGRARPNGFQIVAVPEPASLGMAGLGFLALSGRRRRRRA